MSSTSQLETCFSSSLPHVPLTGHYKVVITISILSIIKLKLREKGTQSHTAELDPGIQGAPHNSLPCLDSQLPHHIGQKSPQELGEQSAQPLAHPQTRMAQSMGRQLHEP